MNNTELTILIPTYNRENELMRLLDCLKKQTNQEFNIIINDNNSFKYSIDELVDKYSPYFKDRLVLCKNVVNIGGAANICKVFSMCNTKWAWLMGDDDIPDENAVSTIYKYLDDSLAALHFTLYDLSNFFHGDYIDIIDLNEFVDIYENMNFGKQYIKNCQGDLICMSEIVYNLEKCMQYYERQNNYAYTKVSQIIPFLFSLDNKNGVYRLINKTIISVDDKNQSWNMGPTMLGMSTFSHIKFKSLSPNRRNILNLIVVFKYKNLMRYWLNGEINSDDIMKIYSNIFKTSLPLKDRIQFKLLFSISPNSFIAKKLIEYKNQKY